MDWLFVMFSLCSSSSDIPAALRGCLDITSPSWWASTFCCSSSSVPSTQPPSFPPGTDCSSDRTMGSAGLDVHWSIVPSWSKWPEALAMQTFYAHFILFSLSSHCFRCHCLIYTLVSGELILRTLMQCVACNLNGSVKKQSFFCSAASDLFFKAYIISVNLVRANLQEMCHCSWFEHYFKIVNGWHSFWIIISEISAEYQS